MRAWLVTNNNLLTVHKSELRKVYVRRMFIDRPDREINEDFHCEPQNMSLLILRPFWQM